MTLFLEKITRSNPNYKPVVKELLQQRLHTYCKLEESETIYGSVMLIHHYKTADTTGEPFISTMMLPGFEITEDDVSLILRSEDTAYKFRKENSA